MKAEELRIGNLIFWDIPEKLNTIHEVIGIRNKKPQTIPISLGESIEDYKPIPLTEEWLKMFGANCIGAKGWNFISVNKADTSYIYFNRNGIGLAIDNGYSKKKIGKELENSYNLQKLLKHSYKNILLDVRKFLLKKRCFSIIACLVKFKKMG